MDIVVEGPDGSGKSTLIQALVQDIARYGVRPRVVVGEGPEKYPGEMVKRLEAYYEDARARDKFVIFDRHPAVSHQVYGPLKGLSVVAPAVTNLLYTFNPLVVYCRPPAVPPTNQTRECDVGQHLDVITNDHLRIRNLYDLWAAERAHLIHRFTDEGSLERVLKHIKMEIYQ